MAGAWADIHGNYGVYVLVDQMIYREDGPQHTQGLMPFATVAFAPSNRNTLPWLFSADLVYMGLIPGRENDTAAFGPAGV